MKVKLIHFCFCILSVNYLFYCVIKNINGESQESGFVSGESSDSDCRWKLSWFFRRFGSD